MRFSDRRDAGRVLGEAVAAARPPSPIVLALPRGGVPVGWEVAKALRCDMDLLLVKKVGVPGHAELAMGAVAEGGVTMVNEGVVAAAGVDQVALDGAIEAAQRQLEEATGMYRIGPILDVQGQTAVIVDDGLATGSTARAAVRVARARGAAEVWLAVPVAPPETVRELASVVDGMVVVHQPRRFLAVGNWYRDFTQVSDGEVRAVMGEITGGEAG